ncbi:nucleotide sugar dehydrogenase [Chloroflexota bacterium]
MNFEKICVLGLGYIGLPTASTFATHGMQVTGVDVNPQIVNTLRNGGLHIKEPGLRTLVQAAIGSGNLKISDKLEFADAFIIAVPTPLLEDKKADLSFVRAAAESIVPVLRLNNLVVLESTSPPRTTVDIVAPILERSGLKAAEDFHLVYSPERVLPGQILRELIENARVIGGVDRISAEVGRELYAIFTRGEVILTDATTAEMVKLMENTQRDVNIATANEFSRLADRLGIDVWDAISMANLHPRIEILNPGPGVGGHCVGVDPWFLVEAAPDLTALIRTARRVNDEQPKYILELIQRGLGISSSLDLAGVRIAVLGLAYKADVDDLRESPALRVVELLSESGALVRVYEPYVEEIEAPNIECAPDIISAVQDADLIALLVAHTPLRNLDPLELIKMTNARVAVDAVNGWSVEKWQDAGFKFIRLGASSI